MTPRLTFNRSLGLGLLLAAASSQTGCLFPDFTFQDGGGTTTSTGGGGTGGTTMTTTTSMGGTTTTSMGGTTTTSMGGTGGTTTTMGGTGGTTTSMGGTGGDTTTSMGGTGGTTMTTSSSTTSSSTMPPVENCQNGIDDDGDGLIDCKDTVDCASFACMAAIPAGWSGYFQLYQGTVAGDPGCSEGYPMEGYSGNYNLNAPPANCNACGCGNPTGLVCSPPPVINVLDTACGGTPTVPLPLNMPGGWTGTCASAQGPNGGYYYMGGKLLCGPDMMQPCNQAVSAEAPTVTGGFCTSSGGGVINVPAATWDSYAHACNGALTTGKGCNLGQTCLPKPQAPNELAICITKAGDVNCPATFPTKHLYYDDYTDSRTCSTCSCSSPTGGTCAGNITIYADSFLDTCTSPDATFAAGTCTNLSGNPSAGNSKFTQTMAPSGASCSASGGQPIGQATKTFPHTFCCAAVQ